MQRRQFLTHAGLAAGAAAIPGAVWAAAADAISPAARDLYAKAIALDCNLYPPLGGNDPPLFAADGLAQIAQSGLTACKASIGGFNASFIDTVWEIGFLLRAIGDTPNAVMQIRDAADFARAKQSKRLGVILSFESATCLEDDVERIELFRNLGVRVMQLSYNQTSPFGAGVLAPAEATLTELGRKAIARMNKVGVALDLSHANAATTTAALAASTKPAVMTHGGCMAVHQNPRNKTDAQLRALADKGGVFGIYDLFYLAPSPRQPNLDDYMAHMTHALSVCGEDHVGIGSDTAFGGSPTDAATIKEWNEETERRRAAGVAAPEEDGRLPYTIGLNRPDRALVIADQLLKRGYPARVAEKVLGGNFVRAFGEIW